MEGMISDGIGSARVGQAGDSRAMSIHMFRATEPRTIEGETQVITIDGTTAANPHVEGVEALAIKMRAGGKLSDGRGLPFDL